MRKIVLLVCLFLLGGCVHSPQSRSELKKTASSHPGMSVLGSHIVNRSFEQVTASLERKWQQCYNVNSTTTCRTGAGVTTSRTRDTYHPNARKVGDSLVEMTLQMTTQGMVMLSKVPKGGEYMVALDVHRLPGNKTKLKWYSPWGWEKSWERNKKWSEGKDVGCDE